MLMIRCYCRRRCSLGVKCMLRRRCEHRDRSDMGGWYSESRVLLERDAPNHFVRFILCDILDGKCLESWFVRTRAMGCFNSCE